MITFIAADLERLLPLGELRARMREALRRHAEGGASSGPRHVQLLPRGAIGAMLGDDGRYLGGKMVCVLPGNAALGLNPHQGIAALFDRETGRPLCVADASTLTALRTAAVSAAATEALAREDASVLAIVGAGEQASRHAEALLDARRYREVRIAGRRREAALSLAERLGDRTEVRVLASPREAAEGADVLCLCTSASDPYLRLLDLPEGIHVNAIGACRPGSREIDLDEGEATIFVAARANAREEAEELRSRSRRGDVFPEIGAVLAGRAGRRHARERTVFKSVGIAAEDVAALALAFEKAGGKP